MIPCIVKCKRLTWPQQGKAKKGRVKMTDLLGIEKAFLWIFHSWCNTTYCTSSIESAHFQNVIFLILSQITRYIIRFDIYIDPNPQIPQKVEWKIWSNGFLAFLTKYQIQNNVDIDWPIVIVLIEKSVVIGNFVCKNLYLTDKNQ